MMEKQMKEKIKKRRGNETGEKGDEDQKGKKQSTEVWI